MYIGGGGKFVLTDLADHVGGLATADRDPWERVDHVSAGPVADLYAEQRVMQLGKLRCVGRAEIRSFFERRNADEVQAKKLNLEIEQL